MIRHWTRHLKTETDPAARRRMIRSRAINTFGLGDDRGRVRDRAAHQVPRRRLDRDPGDGRLLRAHEGHPPPLRQRQPRAGGRRRATRCCPTRVHAIVLVSKLHKPTLRALAFAKATRPNVLEAVLRRRRRRARPTGCCEEWDERGPRRTAQGAVLAVPRDHPADRRVRHADPEGQPARRGRGLHPGVRRRPLVGAAAAQPDRAAAQGPAAVHARA